MLVRSNSNLLLKDSKQDFEINLGKGEVVDLSCYVSVDKLDKSEIIQYALLQKKIEKISQEKEFRRKGRKRV